MDKSTKKDQILQSFEINLQNDFPGASISQKTIDNVIKIFSQVLDEDYVEEKQQKINKLMKTIKSAEEKQAISFLAGRVHKYVDIEILPRDTITTPSSKVQLCPTSDFLSTSNTKISNKSVKENVLYGPAKTDGVTYKIKGNQLVQKRENKEDKEKQVQNPTIWMFQRTLDKRYIWRATQMVDKYDVIVLLFFIFTKRSPKQKLCPAVLINAGSHGGQNGKNAEEAGELSYTDPRIYEQMVQSINQFIEMDEQGKGEKAGLRINRHNIDTKFYIHKVSVDSRCIYPETADHIIDVQCRGAYAKIKAQNLHPSGTVYNPVQLKFLSEIGPQPRKKPAESTKIPDSTKNNPGMNSNKIQTLFQMNQQSPLEYLLKSMEITQQMNPNDVQIVRCPSCSMLSRVKKDTALISCQFCYFRFPNSNSGKKQQAKQNNEAKQCPCCSLISEMKKAQIETRNPCDRCGNSTKGTLLLDCNRCKTTLCQKCLSHLENDSDDDDGDIFMMNQRGPPNKPAISIRGLFQP